jgi:hypothetical protein
MSVLSIFTESVETVHSLFKSSLSLKKEHGNWTVSFITNRGKGSGCQSIPVSELSDAVSALREIADNGITDGDESARIPAGKMIRQTAEYDEGFITFRVSGGKGSKPARIPVSEFPKWVETLERTVPVIQERVNNLK